MTHSEGHTGNGEPEAAPCAVCGEMIGLRAAMCPRCRTPRPPDDTVKNPWHFSGSGTGSQEAAPSFPFTRSASASDELKIKAQSKDQPENRNLPWSDDDFARISAAVTPSAARAQPAPASPAQPMADKPEAAQPAPRLPLDESLQIRPSPVKAATPPVKGATPPSPPTHAPPPEPPRVAPPQVMPSQALAPRAKVATLPPSATQSPWSKAVPVPEPVAREEPRPAQLPRMKEKMPGRTVPSQKTSLSQGMKTSMSGKASVNRPSVKETLSVGEPILAARSGSTSGNKQREPALASPEMNAPPRLFSEKRDVGRPTLLRPSRLMLASVAAVAVLYLAVSQQRSGALPEVKNLADAFATAGSGASFPEPPAEDSMASNDGGTQMETFSDASPAQQSSVRPPNSEASQPDETDNKATVAAAPVVREAPPVQQPVQDSSKTEVAVATGTPPANLTAPNADAGQKTDYVSATGELVTEIQIKLAALGYAPGPIDGALRSRTRDAIRAFQADAGLQATGAISPALVERLRQTRRVHWQLSG